MKGKILDQRGNLFRIKGKTIALRHPLYSYKEVYLIINPLDGKTYTIYKTEALDYLAVSWNSYLKLYIYYQLRLIRYEKDEDIKFSYEKRNRYSAYNSIHQNTKTIGNNRSSNKLSKRAKR